MGVLSSLPDLASFLCRSLLNLSHATTKMQKGYKVTIETRENHILLESYTSLSTYALSMYPCRRGSEQALCGTTPHAASGFRKNQRVLMNSKKT